MPVVAGAKLLVVHDGTTEGSLGSEVLDEAVTALARQQLALETIRLLRLDAVGQAVEVRHGPHQTTPAPGTVEVALEPMLPPPQLIIVGAGHIAQPLCRFATILGFEVTVIDDRARFASRERFPDARQVIADDFERAIATQQVTPWSYIVLVTRGHEHDEATLHRVVESSAPYIGMIGSRRRVLLVFERLAAMGVPARFLERIYAPIGLDIGAQTAEEIALAIMAEIVNLRRGGRSPSLKNLLPKRREERSV